MGLRARRAAVSAVGRMVVAKAFDGLSNETLLHELLTAQASLLGMYCGRYTKQQQKKMQRKRNARRNALLRRTAAREE